MVMMMMAAATTGHIVTSLLRLRVGEEVVGCWRFATLCIYLQLPDGTQQKQRVVVFPLCSPLPSLGPGFWTVFQVLYAVCGRDEAKGVKGLRGGVVKNQKIKVLDRHR